MAKLRIHKQFYSDGNATATAQGGYTSINCSIEKLKKKPIWCMHVGASNFSITLFDHWLVMQDSCQSSTLITQANSWQSLPKIK
jgi:hypothetical protein